MMVPCWREGSCFNNGQLFGFCVVKMVVCTRENHQKVRTATSVMYCHDSGRNIKLLSPVYVRANEESNTDHTCFIGTPLGMLCAPLGNLMNGILV